MTYKELTKNVNFLVIYFTSHGENEEAAERRKLPIIFIPLVTINIGLPSRNNVGNARLTSTTQQQSNQPSSIDDNSISSLCRNDFMIDI